MANSKEGTRTYNLRVPASMYERVRALSDQNHRSINGELTALIELGLKHSRRRGQEVDELPAAPDDGRKDRYVRE